MLWRKEREGEGKYIEIKYHYEPPFVELAVAFVVSQLPDHRCRAHYE